MFLSMVFGNWNHSLYCCGKKKKKEKKNSCLTISSGTNVLFVAFYWQMNVTKCIQMNNTAESLQTKCVWIYIYFFLLGHNGQPCKDWQYWPSSIMEKSMWYKKCEWCMNWYEYTNTQREMHSFLKEQLPENSHGIWFRLEVCIRTEILQNRKQSRCVGGILHSQGEKSDMKLASGLGKTAMINANGNYAFTAKIFFVVAFFCLHL